MKNQRNDSRLGVGFLGFLGEWWLHMWLQTLEGKRSWEKILLCNFMPRRYKISRGIFFSCSQSCTCKVTSVGETFLPHPWHLATKPSFAHDESALLYTSTSKDVLYQGYTEMTDFWIPTSWVGAEGSIAVLFAFPDCTLPPGQSFPSPITKTTFPRPAAYLFIDTIPP